MGFDWRNYNGNSWMTDVRLQTKDDCVAYGTIAALESMLKIHYYNDSEKSIDLDVSDLISKMGTSDISVEHASEILTCNGIETSPNVFYKIAGIDKIKSKEGFPIGRLGDTPGVIEAAKKYIKTSGPIIAVYDDPTVGRHCVAIVGYTGDDNSVDDNWICKDSWPLNGNVPYLNDDTTWNKDGTCKIPNAKGGYREIDADNFIALWAISIQKLNISIVHNGTPITNWNAAYLRIFKNGPTTEETRNLVDVDPTCISRFIAINGTRFNVSKYQLGGDNCLQIKQKTSQEALNNLIVEVAPADNYEIKVHACASHTNEDATRSSNEVGDGDTTVDVKIPLNNISVCAKELMFPGAWQAIKQGQSLDDVKVAIKVLLNIAEISKEDFIEDLDQRLDDLGEAHGFGVAGAQEHLSATEQILELVRSIED